LPGSPPLASQYAYDDGADDQVIGVTSPEPYTFAQTAWMNHFVVQPGKEILTGVAVTFGSRSAGASGMVNGGPAQIFILSEPNGDGNPSDAQILRVANTTVANVDTGSFNRLAITPITLTAGTSFFVGAMATSLPLNRYPAAIDTGYTDSFGIYHPAGHQTDAWIAAGGDGSFGLNGLSTAEYFGNPATLIGPGDAGPFMVRAETVAVPEPETIAPAVAVALLANSGSTAERTKGRAARIHTGLGVFPSHSLIDADDDRKPLTEAGHTRRRVSCEIHKGRNAPAGATTPHGPVYSS
jgi:hypothetical protein